MRRYAVTSVLATGIFLARVTYCVAQGAPGPTPGPTHPGTPNPQAKPGATIVVNPTAEECRQGWKPGAKWTKQQFEEFCAKLRASK